jgi:hypothetical protein
MKPLLLMTLVLGLATPRLQAAEPVWNKKAAAERLDERANWWLDFGMAQRATDGKGATACLSCHTTVPYGLARPLLTRVLATEEPSVVERLRTNIHRRIEAGDAATELYDFNEDKKKESRGTEAVLSTLLLAWGDAVRHEPAPSAATKKALTRLWETQRPDGGWDWFQFSFEPWETKDSQYFGAAQAAFAVGTAPGYYSDTASPELEQKVESLRKYLITKRDKSNLHSEVWLLLASTKLKGLLTPAEQMQIVQVLKGKQHGEGDSSGGWVLLELSTWRYNAATAPKTPPKLNPTAKAPDAYATGLITYSLLQAGLKTDDPTVASALKWLNRTQKPDGSWPAVSINVDRKPGTAAEYFMSDAATAWAVIALVEAEGKK